MTLTSGAGIPLLAAEEKEPLLELAARGRELRQVLVQGRAQGGGAATAAPENGLQRGRVEEPAVVGVGERLERPASG